MRIAWFRPAPVERAAPADDTAFLVDAARARHDVELVDASRAHDFVWRQARSPADLCVHELHPTPAHRYIAAYAIHFPGLLLLRSLPRHRRALLASRLTVVAHEAAARAVADDHPEARVRSLIPGVRPLPDTAPDVVEAFPWPLEGAAFADAIAGFAAGRAVIVPDCLATADWPSLDPQSWQRRGHAGAAEPICVSVDPRDQAHSLDLARRRLAEDAALRARLGAAAHAWWRRHATPELAASSFEALLQEATALPPPDFDADEGMRRARALVTELGLGALAKPGTRLWEPDSRAPA